MRILRQSESQKPLLEADACSHSRFALTAGFRPSLSNVFLFKGPSMVMTPAEFPSAQLHGPVGLMRGNYQDFSTGRMRDSPSL